MFDSLITVFLCVFFAGRKLGGSKNEGARKNDKAINIHKRQSGFKEGRKEARKEGRKKSRKEARKTKGRTGRCGPGIAGINEQSQ